MTTRTFRIPGADGAVIRATAHRPAGRSRGLVLVAHGFKGFREWGFHPHLAAALAAEGFEAVRFDFSHNGVADDPTTFERLDLFERNTFTKEIDDLDAVLAHVRAWPHVDAARIATVGHSRGGGVALLHARHRGGVRAVATLASIATTDRLTSAEKATLEREGRLLVRNARTQQLMPLGRELEEDRRRHAARLDVERAVAELAIPVLLVHGTADESVPFAEAERLARAQPNARLVPIQDAGHTFGVAHPFADDPPAWREARGAVIVFLDEVFAVP